MVEFTRENCIVGEMRNVMLEKEKRDTLLKISERDNIMNESDEQIKERVGFSMAPWLSSQERIALLER